MTPPAATGIVAHGVAVRHAPGERRTGDRAVVAPYPGGTVLAVVDGLGHGPRAADAADAAADAVTRAAGRRATEIMDTCHAALRRTRGAAIAVADVPDGDDLEWLSVGNVAAAVVGWSPRRVRRLPSRGGILGLRLPPLRPVRIPWSGGDLMVLHTDGVADTVVGEVRPATDLTALADGLLAQHVRGADDALVLVARFGGRR